MYRAVPDRRSSVAAWGVVALLAAAASAGPARADCGDYVHIGTAAAPAAHDSAQAPKPPAEPCHGPDCVLRKHAPSPLAPSAPPAEPGPSDAILAPAPPPDPDPTGRVVPCSPHLPAGPVAAIFHPPKPR